MINNSLNNKETRAYIFLTSSVMGGLAGSLIIAPKIVHFGVNFPFSNIVFLIFTYLRVNKYLDSNTQAFQSEIEYEAI